MKHKYKPRMPGMKVPPSDDYAKSRSFTSRDGTALQQALKDALDPIKVPGKVTRLNSMSPEKRAEMERLYGSPGSPKESK